MVPWQTIAHAIIVAALAVLGGLCIAGIARRSRRVRAAEHITRTGIVFSLLTLAIAIVALNTKINFLVLVFGMLLSAIVLSFVLSRVTMRRLEFARALPEGVHAGEPLAVELRVASRKRRLTSYGLVVQDELPAGLSAQRPGGVVLELPAGQSVPLAYRAVADRRGVYPFRTVSFSTRFPFGLFHQGRARALPGELVVYPRLGEVAGEFLARARILASSAQRMRGARGEEEFRNLREYRHGDNPRRIHWKTSAKLGKPLVREMEALAGERALLLLDTRCPASGEAALEAAVSFAATVARDLMLRGFLVGLAAYAPELAVAAPAKGQAALRALFETLARLEPNPARSLADLVAEPRVRSEERALAIVALRRRDADAEEALDLLQRRQARVLAVDASNPSFSEVFWFRHETAPGSE